MNFLTDQIVFVICLVIGEIALFKFCLEQFEKPTQTKSEKDPWPFIVPKFLASPRQYLLGFSFYLGILTLLFVFFSFLLYLKPEVLAKMIAGISKAQSVSSLSAQPSAAPQQSDIPSVFGPTSPIVIAFAIVGLNPNFKLPKYLDIELLIRKAGLRIAYIPKGMNDIFVFMRYAGYTDFTVPERELKETWNEVGIRPVKSDLEELKPAIELMNHVAFFYGRAATLAGELNLPLAAAISDNLNIDVFRAYRSDIQRVLTMLQAAQGRISEQVGAPQEDHSQAVQEIQRDLNQCLEFLYTLFACAITAKGTERLSERLRAFGITKPYPPQPQIPWNPILLVTGASAFVLFVGWAAASETLLASRPGLAASGIPLNTVDIGRWLLNAFLVHIVAIALSTRIRTRLIDRDKYVSVTGSTNVSAYATIFFKCAAACFCCYAILTSTILLNVLTSEPDAHFLRVFLSFYFVFCAAWSLVPASCAVMTAMTLDRRSEKFVDRIQSGVLEAVVMGCAALLAVELVSWAAPALAAPPEIAPAIRLFTVIVYAGLGLVFGSILPSAITRHRRALESRLPERISTLRNAVSGSFIDMEGFYRWLRTNNAKLGGRRPLDVLEDESGLQVVIDSARTGQAAEVALTVH